jgi:S1-C subfamily serine protease
MIAEVLGDSPAAKAGLVAGDLILEFAGSAIFTVDDLHRALTAEIADVEVDLLFIRGADVRSVRLRVGADG